MTTRNSVPVQPGMFRSPLLPAAAVFLALGFSLGLGSLFFLLDPTYPAAITGKLITSGIRTASALSTWRLIHICVSLAGTLCPALTLWGIFRAAKGRYAKGLNFLSDGAKYLRRAVHISAAAALALCLFRTGRYLLSLIGRGDWLYQLFAFCVMEGLMIVQAVFLYRLLCRFLEDCEGCAASMAYTLSSGKLDPGGIPAFCPTGLVILGILGIVLSVDRMVTMTIGSDGYQQYYKFLISTHPGQWLCAASSLFGGIGDILLSLYVRFYSRSSERAIFYATFQK